MKHNSSYIKYILSLFVAVVLLYFSFKDVHWNDFIESLKQCNWGYLVIAFFIGIFAFYIRGLRWRILLLPVDENISKITSINAINIGNISNFIFPRIGEFIRCGVITKKSQKIASFDKVLGTVVMERSWDLIGLFLSISLVFILMWNEVSAFFIENIFSSISKMMTIRLVLILGLIFLCIGSSVFLLWKFREKWQITKKIYEVLIGIISGFLSGLKVKKKWLFLLYTAFIWTLYWAMSYFSILALPQLANLNAADALFLMMVGSLGWLVPVPGGIGSYHFIVATALSTVYGLPFEVGIIFATISHESQTLSMILTGGLSYLYESLTS